MSEPRILIAGVGNIFFGDDAFGVEVAARLAERRFPPGVCVRDFGIRGLDLAYALLDGYETVILVDATPRGGLPGSLYLIEPKCEESSGASAGTTLDAHALDPVQVIRYAESLGGPLPRLLLVGCEPAPLSAEEMKMGLSEPVRRAVDETVGVIESLAAKLLSENDGSAIELTGALRARM